MAGLSTTSAATEGFQLIKNNPMAVALWGLVIAVATAVAVGLVLATVGVSALANFPEIVAAARNDVEPDPAKLIAFASSLFTAILIVVLVFIVVDAVLVTAVKRAVLRPEQRSPGYMRLGGDEIRTFLVRLVQWLVVTGVWAVIVLAAIIGGRAVHPALAVLVCLAGLPLGIFVWVKLSLAVSQSFAEQRFNLFGSWTLTKGHFWELFGAYILAVIFYIIIAIALSIIAGIAGGNALMTEMMTDPDNVDFSNLGPIMVIGGLVNAVANIITKTFELPILGAPPAYAYRELALDAAD